MADLYKYGIASPYINIGNAIILNDVYAEECDSCVQKIKDLPDAGIIRFLHVTDTHHGANSAVLAEQSYLSMINVAKRIGASFILHTGDMITSGSGTSSDGWKKTIKGIVDVMSNSNVPFIVSRGNHDDNSVGSNVGNASNVISNLWWNWETGSVDGELSYPDNANGYYYIDYPTKGIRVVNANASDLTEEERLNTGGQNYMVLSQSQLDWLDNVAFATDKKVIMCIHANPSSWNPNASITNRTMLYDILKKHTNIKLCMFGHNHVSGWYKDSVTGITFACQTTAGGNITTFSNADWHTSYATQDARNNCPTGAFNFSVVCMHSDGSIDRIRWGVEDDVTT